MDYRYLAEKLSDARRRLMLPHPDGEEQDIMNALFECSKVLRDQPLDGLDASARDWAATILGAPVTLVARRDCAVTGEPAEVDYRA